MWLEVYVPDGALYRQSLFSPFIKRRQMDLLFTLSVSFLTYINVRIMSGDNMVLRVLSEFDVLSNVIPPLIFSDYHVVA